MLGPFAWIAGLAMALAGTTSAGNPIPLDLALEMDPDLTPVVHALSQRCGCESSIPGPDGGPPRINVPSGYPCRDTTECDGECVYYAISPSTQPPDYVGPCNVNRGVAACTPPCPPARAGYVEGYSACTSHGGVCDGICRWEDPATHEFTLDRCHRL